MVLTCNPSQEVEQENRKFKASLGYIVSSFLKNKQKTKVGWRRKGREK